MKHVVLINENLEIVPFRQAQFKQDLERFKGKKIVVDFGKYYNPRSHDQNEYYWGVLIYMIHQVIVGLGNEDTPQELHEQFKSKFLTIDKPILNQHTGEIIATEPHIQSTAKLDKKAMFDYIEKIRRWAATVLYLDIPDPNIYAQRPDLDQNCQYCLHIWGVSEGKIKP